MRSLVGLVLAGALLIALLPAPAAAQGAMSPVGRWKTHDDDTGEEKGIVRIREEGGKLYGVIEHVYPKPGLDPNPKCEKCEGAKKDKPVVGLEILWGLERDGDEWTGGRILDPENGKTYRCFIEVIDGGRRLKVRGYLGVSLFGRTQYWDRLD